MTISIFVIMCTCYVAMFMHDKAVMQSYTHYQIESCLQNGQSVDLEIKDSLKGKLFLVRIQQVYVSKQVLQVRTTMNYTLSLSIPILKRALLNGNTNAELIIYHSYFKPSNLLWDAYILKGESD